MFNSGITPNLVILFTIFLLYFIFFVTFKFVFQTKTKSYLIRLLIIIFFIIEAPLIIHIFQITPNFKNNESDFWLEIIQPHIINILIFIILTKLIYNHKQNGT
jgi:hypothetical protein